jgi:hypothetical protein
MQLCLPTDGFTVGIEPVTLQFHTNIKISYYRDSWGHLKLYFDTNNIYYI